MRFWLLRCLTRALACPGRDAVWLNMVLAAATRGEQRRGSLQGPRPRWSYRVCLGTGFHESQNA